MARGREGSSRFLATRIFVRRAGMPRPSQVAAGVATRATFCVGAIPMLQQCASVNVQRPTSSKHNDKLAATCRCLKRDLRRAACLEHSGSASSARLTILRLRCAEVVDSTGFRWGRLSGSRRPAKSKVAGLQRCCRPVCRAQLAWYLTVAIKE